MKIRTAVFTTLALTAFAANSLLCRLALRDGAIDPASFSTVRLIAGAAMLWLIAIVTGRRRPSPSRSTWTSAIMLFLYAAGFSYAYISLSVGTGALILFGTVQGTMILAGILAGEHLHPVQWGGLLAALAGLLYLVFPGLTAPSPAGSALMAAAGVAWGIYSLRGRRVGDAIAGTADNFIWSLPFAILLSAVLFQEAHLSLRGFLLALVSGSVTSGIGYVLWYGALQGLTRTRAASVQLAVPVLAAFAAVLFLGESVTVRLIVASAAILGGIAFALQGGRPNPSRQVR